MSDKSNILTSKDENLVRSKKLGGVIKEVDPFEKGIKVWLKHQFSPQYWNKFQVILETRIYNKHNEHIHDQKVGKTHRVCEVYFDGEYVCDIGEHDPKHEATTKLYVGLNRIKRDREDLAKRGQKTNKILT